MAMHILELLSPELVHFINELGNKGSILRKFRDFFSDLVNWKFDKKYSIEKLLATSIFYSFLINNIPITLDEFEEYADLKCWET